MHFGVGRCFFCLFVCFLSLKKVGGKTKIPLKK
ncbi:similar to hypothetical protein (predicted), isoform CRA_c [Rattus norvegicus]|uniref:Uncharacterized protein RGD1564195_predicted n=1 Tax=Rattus norvegicus TaxID=10116 RepID=A6I9K0_RAT|nr:similar to hypothetical protein (predicted), isoform CRA_c [Rattus norvegicus]